jgi:hypothetical protein
MSQVTSDIASVNLMQFFSSMLCTKCLIEMLPLFVWFYMFFDRQCSIIMPDITGARYKAEVGDSPLHTSITTS